MSEPRDPQKLAWSEWWRLLNSTPWHDAIRGRLTGTVVLFGNVCGCNHSWESCSR